MNDITTQTTVRTINAVDEILGVGLRQGSGEHTALICEDQSLSYAQLDCLTNRYGNAFKARGIGFGDRVLFLLDDSPDLVAAYLGTMRIGAVAVAYNVRAAAKDLLFVIQDTQCRLLLIEEPFLPLFEAIADRIEGGLEVVVLGNAPSGYCSGAQLLQGQPDILVPAATTAQDMAFWIYSSGTTGTPKAAVHLHRSVLIADRHLREHLGVRPGDRLFTTSKLFFAFALGHSLFGGLRCGATLILHRGWPDAAGIAATVERQRPDLVFSVPTLYRNLLRDGVAQRPAFGRVRHYVAAGEKLPESLSLQWAAETGRPVLEGIGTSETIFLFIANTPAAVRPGSCGRPVPWAEVLLLDDTGRAVTKDDTPGTLWVRMPSLFSGYWHRPEQTRQVLAEGWYCSGDMFSHDAAGWWYHHGRADDMLKVSGQWVSPVEIEECALGVPGVEEAAAVGLENDDGLVRAALFLVFADGCNQDDRLIAAVKERLRTTLSIYKCPRLVRRIEEVPRTASGKVQRYRLRELLVAESASAPP